jgi:dephospho-CoA kinase
MFVLGITGGIGSGKSAATEIFSSLGIKIVDADVLSRVPVQKGESGLLEIEKRYGAEILLSTGELDRKKLREIIFEKEEEKDWLENLLHPLISDLIKEELKSSTSAYTILASPLLFETKQSSYCDEVLVIDVSEETQVLRTKTRDDVSEEQVKTIILSQINRSERLRLATHIIENENTLKDLKKAVTDLHQKIITQIETK